jgi:hypothetical protein
MFEFLKFLTKRPSDKIILIWRIIFWILLIGVFYYNLIILGKWVDFPFIGKENILYVKYSITALWIIPMLLWITNLCLFKSKYVRIIQIIFWVILLYISSIIQESPSLDFDTLIFLMGLLPLLAGITGKCITSKCLKYWQKITKVRV